MFKIKMKDIVSSRVNPATGELWTRGSPDLDVYVKELEARVFYAQHFFDSPQSFSDREFAAVAARVYGEDIRYTGKYVAIGVGNIRYALLYAWSWLVDDIKTFFWRFK